MLGDKEGISRGTKVMVIMNTSRQNGDEIRNKYIGHTGEITNDYSYGYRYAIKFDDVELQHSCRHEGSWLWSEEEVIKLEDQTFIR